LVFEEFNENKREGPSPSSVIFRWNGTRREFVMNAAAVASGFALGMRPFKSAHAAAQQAGLMAESHLAAQTVGPVTLTINGTRHQLSLDPRVTLLDLLRNELELTGTKKGCDHGQCGACTVLVNGRRINSCLSLAAAHHGEEITTIEGIAPGGDLHPMQAAFLEYDGLQCGYCTPGQICSAVALLEEARAGDPSFVTTDLSAVGAVQLTHLEIRERMSGNICRCGAYPGITKAVESVSRGSASNIRSGS
jgi:xanthine dehydrogenase YagT iron-sulfur-binding subunit